MQRISTGSPFEERFGYSRAVRHGDTVYVSGTTGYDYAAMRLPEAAGEQARNALATIDRALRELGASLADTVRVVYYVADAADIDVVAAAVGPVFRDIRPAATMVLARLLEPAMKVEIELTAVLVAGTSA
jgi:enamine deaminase RidA (YjgF/YER057c/UK114 family)